MRDVERVVGKTSPLQIAHRDPTFSSIGPLGLEDRRPTRLTRAFTSLVELILELRFALQGEPPDLQPGPVARGSARTHTLRRDE